MCVCAFCARFVPLWSGRFGRLIGLGLRAPARPVGWDVVLAITRLPNRGQAGQSWARCPDYQKYPPGVKKSELKFLSITSVLQTSLSNLSEFESNFLFRMVSFSLVRSRRGDIPWPALPLPLCRWRPPAQHPSSFYLKRRGLFRWELFLHCGRYFP